MNPPATTPALHIDLERLDANLRRMQDHADRLGVALRPHVKTHKCLPIAQRQQALGAAGITVSTLQEAEAFFAAGFDDIFYAVAVAPAKLERVQALRAAGCKLRILVDGLAGAQAVAQAAQRLGHRFEVMIEIDSDGHRAGLPPDAPELTACADALAGAAEVAGVMAHAGSSYACSDAEAIASLAEQERTACVAAAIRLRNAGHACPVVSVGSTPTALGARRLDGVTELRAGVYAFFDLVMLGTGSCSRDDLAMFVRASVTGHQASKGRVLIDAGWMAMSRDRGTQSQARDWGYGALRDTETGRWIEGLNFTMANQEHGVLQADSGIDVVQVYPVGRLLDILPNHACATAAQFGGYWMRGAGAGVGPSTGTDGETDAYWARSHGW